MLLGKKNILIPDVAGKNILIPDIAGEKIF
jgi:hypothetical protein